MKRLSLRQFNNGLSLVVIGLCLYILAAPWLPDVTFWWQQSVVRDIPPLVAAHQNKSTPEVIPDEDTLVIPRINLQQRIYVGPRAYPSLNQGVWAYPRASSPDHGGNTVLIGHRFTYGGPAVFYHLDKIKPGDDMVVYWRKQKYTYRVAETKIVPPTATEIQAPTKKPTLTIYTCTPLVTAKNRLVVIAHPLSGDTTEEQDVKLKQEEAL